MVPEKFNRLAGLWRAAAQMNLEEWPIPWRFALTFIIVLVILFALALFGYLSGRWDDAQAQPLPPSKYDQDIIELDRAALNEAYRDRVRHLFAIWMSDFRDQPHRALTGVVNARRAYISAMTEIEKREHK